MAAGRSRCFAAAAARPIGWPGAEGRCRGTSGDASSVAPRSTFRGDVFAAFDRLPTQVRRQLHEAVVPWDPREIAWHIRNLLAGGGNLADVALRVADEIRAADIGEVNAFSCRHWKRYGVATPHVRAGGSFQRYGRGA